MSYDAVARNGLLHLYYMKLTSLILAILIVFLSGMPCDDSAVASANTQLHHDHGGGSAESDNCSPFCVCRCCQVPVVIPVPSLYTPLTVLNRYTKTSYYQGFYSNGINHSIWHPPQSV